MGCRNCESQNLRELGFTGEVAPFFLKRVLNLELHSAVASHPLRRLARRVFALPQKFFAAAFGCSVFTEMQICNDCSFVQTKHPFGDDALARLYADYRSDTYNRERIHYEPSYAGWAEHIGKDDVEVEARVATLTAWLADKLATPPEFSMLDFGGADGRFLPRLPGKKFVFEISNVASRERVCRIGDEANLQTYSYVQLAHVLEHAAQPLALLKRVARLAERSGYLYLEVPQDLTDTQLAQLRDGAQALPLTVHEHINVYCPLAMEKLVNAAGLELVHASREQMDLGWTSATIVRALCRRP